jgi:hypothetical protein
MDEKKQAANATIPFLAPLGKSHNHTFAKTRDALMYRVIRCKFSICERTRICITELTTNKVNGLNVINGWQIKPVTGDGNCFFHATARSLNTDEKYIKRDTFGTPIEEGRTIVSDVISAAKFHFVGTIPDLKHKRGDMEQVINLRRRIAEYVSSDAGAIFYDYLLSIGAGAVDMSSLSGWQNVAHTFSRFLMFSGSGGDDSLPLDRMAYVQRVQVLGEWAGTFEPLFLHQAMGIQFIILVRNSTTGNDGKYENVIRIPEILSEETLIVTLVYKDKKHYEILSIGPHPRVNRGRFNLLKRYI